MRWLFRRHWGHLIDDLEDFRARIPFVTPEEYRDVYARLPRVQSETDNSAACIDLIARDMVGDSALDVGCGTGYLLHVLSSRRSEEHTSELQSLMRISYAVFCLKNKNTIN